MTVGSALREHVVAELARRLGRADATIASTAVPAGEEILASAVDLEASRAEQRLEESRRSIQMRLALETLRLETLKPKAKLSPAMLRQRLGSLRAVLVPVLEPMAASDAQYRQYVQHGIIDSGSPSADDADDADGERGLDTEQIDEPIEPERDGEGARHGGRSADRKQDDDNTVDDEPEPGPDGA